VELTIGRMAKKIRKGRTRLAPRIDRSTGIVDYGEEHDFNAYRDEERIEICRKSSAPLLQSPTHGKKKECNKEGKVHPSVWLKIPTLCNFKREYYFWGWGNKWGII